jgi:hypothetical protein
MRGRGEHAAGIKVTVSLLVDFQRKLDGGRSASQRLAHEHRVG